MKYSTDEINDPKHVVGGNVLGKALRIVLAMFVFVCVFDPADKLLYMKVPLFVLVWLVFIVKHLCDKGTLTVPFSIVVYLMLFSCVLPALSMLNFALSNQTLVDYDGFGYLKAYLFLSLIFVLFVEDIDLNITLSVMMMLLSIAIIAVLIMLMYGVIDVMSVVSFGKDYGMIGLHGREYGGYDYTTIDIYASPLLVLSVAYFTYLFIKKEGFAKLGIMILLAVNIVAMHIAGTRSSILLCILTPLATWIIYTRRKFLVIGMSSVLLIIAGSSIKDILSDALSFRESSNAMRLSYFRDYAVVFDNLKNLLIGQGLGAKFYVTGKGEYLSIVETTYIELVRNYGLLFSVFYFIFLAYPFIRYRAYRSEWYILIAYAGYLFSSIFNPLIFSSTGMLILSIVFCKAFKSIPLENKVPNS